MTENTKVKKEYIEKIKEKIDRGAGNFDSKDDFF